MSEIELPEVRLGKKLGHVEDRRTFRLAGLMVEEALPTPPRTWRIAEAEEIRMYRNDEYGCCTFTAQAHRADVQERSSRQAEVQISDADVLAAYSGLTGFDRTKPWTDRGAYMLDVLNWMRHLGLGQEADGSPHTIFAYAALPVPLDPETAKWAAWAFGGIYVGAWLPLSAARQYRADESWKVISGPEAEAGSWGGHAMHMTGYAAKTVQLATWGGRQLAEWDWMSAYVDEAYVVISEDQLRKSGRTPQGFDVEALDRLLDRL